MKKCPGVLNANDGSLRIDIKGLQFPVLAHLQPLELFPLGNFRITVQYHDSNEIVDQFSGQTTPFVMTGQKSTRALSCKSVKSLTLRLVGLDNGETHVGRLEMYQKGTWGTVGGRSFSHREARVACRAMGMAGGEYLSASDRIKYRSLDVTQPQWVYDVSCPNENFEKLDHCNVDWLVSGSGDHVFDVSIKCTSSETMFRGVAATSRSSYRLADGLSTNEGRVEILHNNVWKPICGLDWDINDATVLCSELGYSHALSASHNGSDFPRSKSSPVHQVRFHCNGNEGSLEWCVQNSTLEYNEYCTHDVDAGAICSDSRQSCDTHEAQFDKYCQIPDTPLDTSFQSPVYSSSDMGRSAYFADGFHRNAASLESDGYTEYDDLVELQNWVGSDKAQAYRTTDERYARCDGTETSCREMHGFFDRDDGPLSLEIDRLNDHLSLNLRMTVFLPENSRVLTQTITASSGAVDSAESIPLSSASAITAASISNDSVALSTSKPGASVTLNYVFSYNRILVVSDFVELVLPWWSGSSVDTSSVCGGSALTVAKSGIGDTFKLTIAGFDMSALTPCSISITGLTNPLTLVSPTIHSVRQAIFAAAGNVASTLVKNVHPVSGGQTNESSVALSEPRTSLINTLSYTFQYDKKMITGDTITLGLPFYRSSVLEISNGDGCNSKLFEAKPFGKGPSFKVVLSLLSEELVANTLCSLDLIGVINPSTPTTVQRYTGVPLLAGNAAVSVTSSSITLAAGLVNHIPPSSTLTISGDQCAIEPSTVVTIGSSFSAGATTVDLSTSLTTLAADGDDCEIAYTDEYGNSVTGIALREGVSATTVLSSSLNFAALSVAIPGGATITIGPVSGYACDLQPRRVVTELGASISATNVLLSTSLTLLPALSSKCEISYESPVSNLTHSFQLVGGVSVSMPPIILNLKRPVLQGYHSYVNVWVDNRQVWSKTKNKEICANDGWSAYGSPMYKPSLADGNSRTCFFDLDITVPFVHTGGKCKLEIYGVPADESALWGFSDVLLKSLPSYEISNKTVVIDGFKIRDDDLSYDDAKFACERRGLSLCPYEAFCASGSDDPTGGAVFGSQTIFAYENTGKNWAMLGAKCHTIIESKAPASVSKQAPCCKKILSEDACEELCWGIHSCAAGYFDRSSGMCHL
eukprot:Stramenopile-MAST_4_protein_4024